ncbi:hypothetical protein PSH47_14975 [Pseudoalteromonas sp. CST5]|jgi:hypothetical protein|uniref:hypothetical protein n=1 Tax=unclassified Pseudoalteromonas TaxID=194690 RepID=UPI002359B11D|nr:MULTISPECIES: hypothetical protein [unclassified Pseudoalteromonas]MDC9514214.1 hypothetical protein [Pseudoalteromonas sp. CST1]MDC9538686.1 hypothetical protein [Pseudoalteromonas sp. CST3]MDC9542901.1 hypothetical protein [Pseudoalteromonas sp. CST2]MDC9545598.1 hypothetical protein [Pseudoalteromonas sp. CST4]MDC9550435.1 hypothetical protein [Pseudoalteromonas sp. CST5]
MSKVNWISAPLGIKGNLEAWKSLMDSHFPSPTIGNIYLITYDNGERVGYLYKGIHSTSGENWWERVKEEVIESYFDTWLSRAVAGKEDSVLEGMTQALDPEIRSSMESLHDEGFDDEILADFAHQMSKR